MIESGSSSCAFLNLENRFIQLVCRHQVQRIPFVAGGVAGIQRQSLFELLLSLLSFPIVSEPNVGKRSVRVGEGIVERQGFLGGRLRLGHGLTGILDAPGADTGFIQGTLALAINPAGQVTGFYSDANSVYHGFLWIPPSQ